VTPSAVLPANSKASAALAMLAASLSFEMDFGKAGLEGLIGCGRESMMLSHWKAQ
jgi:hypothetical protein